ncbi:MAG: phytanoyl-CoA dioxygenase family protein [Alphaproteobacteria bacterium]|nr:phytanoyl-CoA dioxygenase family protein [Alphaproteobacteria bacterium]
MSARLSNGEKEYIIVVNLPLLDLPPTDYGSDEAAMTRYREEGTARALALDNRGPIQFDSDGKLDPAILDAYSRHGFYVFEKVLKSDELSDIEDDLVALLERAPVSKDAHIDKHGRPSFDDGQKSRTIRWVAPLSDPLGGTDASYGRHPAKMVEPEAPEGAPDHVIQIIHGSLQHSPACLRLYGHPQLLAVAEAINGPDFAPFNEAIWIKQPRLGGSVAWHQDGWTHWDDPALDEGTHGFNYMAQLYGCDAANGLWVVPGSHRRGKVDIMAMVEAAGSDRLPDAVPLICGPGDVAITNRQAVHGSFANTSPNIRVTLNMGFHRRRSVLGVKSGGVHNPVSTYDEAYIRNRARLILYGIDARRQRYPDETPYRYAPMADSADSYRWTPAAMAEIRDYNLQDIGI